MNATLQTLQKRHPRFVYQNFAYALEENNLRITFSFLLEPDIFFTPSVLIEGISENEFSQIAPEALDNLIFHLGLAEIPSYWKCAVSPIIEVRAGCLEPKQTAFLRKLIEKGLAEFFYRNYIAPQKNIPRIVSSGVLRTAYNKKSPQKGSILLAVGGGKDSLVAIEMLKKAKWEFRPMVLGNVLAAYRLAEALGAKKPITIRRKIDPKLVELNTRGYLNGHVPFSAYLAFLSTLVAELLGFEYIAVANERSANEPTVKTGSVIINHQYSKSFAFERDFRMYAKEYLSKHTHYLSIMRPLYEIQIAKIAAQFPRGLRAAVSCNAEQKEAQWCGACAKCMAVFILLFPFVETKTLVKMFGKNIFDDGTLWRFIPELAGFAKTKPFDCVGTVEEMQAALILSLRKSERQGNVPKILARFKREFLPKIKMRDKDIGYLMGSWHEKNFLPTDLAKTLRAMINIP